MDILNHNRNAWNNEVLKGNQWTIPVSRDEIKAVKDGVIKILLTPFKPVPQYWLGDLHGLKVLCLASGGGQQGPLLAAAGAQVTVFDNADHQLQQDEEAAVAHGLRIQTVQGNMQDLSAFSKDSFDLIFHPISNCFVDDVLPVWRECARVLKPDGVLLSGFVNPLVYMIDWEEADTNGVCRLVFTIPYSDTHTLSPADIERYRHEKIPFEFGHSLTDLIQGQIAAGFHITGFYEDKGEPTLDQFTDVYIATRAVKVG